MSSGAFFPFPTTVCTYSHPSLLRLRAPGSGGQLAPGTGLAPGNCPQEFAQRLLKERIIKTKHVHLELPVQTSEPQSFLDPPCPAGQHSGDRSKANVNAISHHTLPLTNQTLLLPDTEFAPSFAPISVLCFQLKRLDETHSLSDSLSLDWKMKSPFWFFVCFIFRSLFYFLTGENVKMNVVLFNSHHNHLGLFLHLKILKHKRCA